MGARARMDDHQHKPYDPLTSERPPRRRKSGLVPGIALATVLFAGIGYYVWSVRFEAKFQEFSDQAVKVNILHPPPPPPPPRHQPPQPHK